MYLITRAEKMAGGGVARQVEASVIKSGNPQVEPWNPQGERGESVSESCPLTATHICLHTVRKCIFWKQGLTMYLWLAWN